MKMNETTPRKSALVKEAEKVFSYQQPNYSNAPIFSVYPTEQVLVETFTTYSVGEAPIPDNRKRG